MSEMEAQDLGSRIKQGVPLAIAEAVEEHRLLGRSIVVWRDGRVVTLKPEEITPLRDKEFSDL